MRRSASDRRAYRFGRFELEAASGELWKDGAPVRLQDKPLQVLLLLLEHRGELTSREHLKQRLWPADTFVDFETGLNTAVSKLRDALDDSAENPVYIQTLPRRGYRFVCPLEADEVADDAPQLGRSWSLPAPASLSRWAVFGQSSPPAQ